MSYSHIILYSIILICFFLYLGGTKITFSPFTFRMEHVWTATGWVYISIGLITLQLSMYNRGVKDGINQTVESFTKAIEHFDFERKVSPEDTTKPE